jgi:hypothetical protein
MTHISRRDFLKVLGAAALSPLVHASPEVRVQARKVYLITVPIAGFYYYDGMDYDVFESLAVGDELELRREPDNPYDANAIEVYTRDGNKLGYVPRVNNPIPAAIADQDVVIGAEIIYVDEDPDEYPPLSMRLYIIV